MKLIWYVSAGLLFLGAVSMPSVVAKLKEIGEFITASPQQCMDPIGSPQTGKIGKIAQKSIQENYPKNDKTYWKNWKISGPNGLSKCPESREMDFGHFWEKSAGPVGASGCRGLGYQASNL